MLLNKKYIVRLSDEARAVCQDVVKRLKGTSQKVRRAQMLLKADADGPAWPDAKIVDAFGGVVQTVEKLRQRLVTEGFEAALQRKRRETPPTPRQLDGVAETKLIAMRLGPPPAGYGRWSLQLLADEWVVLEVVDSICPETVRKTLKKRHSALKPTGQGLQGVTLSKYRHANNLRLSCNSSLSRQGLPIIAHRVIGGSTSLSRPAAPAGATETPSVANRRLLVTTVIASFCRP